MTAAQRVNTRTSAKIVGKQCTRALRNRSVRAIPAGTLNNKLLVDNSNHGGGGRCAAVYRRRMSLRPTTNCRAPTAPGRCRKRRVPANADTSDNGGGGSLRSSAACSAVCVLPPVSKTSRAANAPNNAAITAHACKCRHVKEITKVKWANTSHTRSTNSAQTTRAETNT